MMNIPKVKAGIVAVSRDCFPESLSVNRRKALVEAYRKKYDGEDIYECPVCLSLIHISVVFNTGDAIPEEDLEKIWIKFYKVDKARTREYGGSGIGLSIVKAIMESMHQELSLIHI